MSSPKSRPDNDRPARRGFPRQPSPSAADGARTARAPRVRSPWRTVLKAGLYLLLFAAAFVVFDRSLFILWRAGATRHYAALAKRGGFSLDKNSIFGKAPGDLLIFGTSRTRKAVDFARIGSSLHVRVIREAEAGRFPEYAYRFYQEYRRVRRKPKAVLYGVDYFMFDKQTSPEDLAALGVGISPERLDPGRAMNSASPLLSRASWLFRMKPGMDALLADTTGMQGSFEPDQGFERALFPGRNRLGRVRRAATRIRSSQVTRPARFARRPYRAFPGEEGAYFDKLLAEFGSEGIPVLLVILPDYVATNETNFQQAKFKADIRNIAARHGGVRVLDFNVPGRFDLTNPDKFEDGAWGKSNCHLSLTGKKAFSSRLIPAVGRALRVAGEAGSLSAGGGK